MSRFKTKSAKEYRSFVGSMRVLKKENPFLYRVEVKLLNDKTNRNNWRYERLEEHRHLFADTPILVAYVGNKVGDGHNFQIKRDRKGEEYASFTDANAERIVGWFANEQDIRIENMQGSKWIVGVGHIWTWYAAELVEMLDKQGEMSISIETLVENIRYDGDTEVYDTYQILGTTILGEGVSPAVAGANIRSLADIGVALNEFKLKVAAEQSKQKGVKKTLKKEKKFPDYHVLGTENGITCLLSKLDGKLYMEENDQMKPATAMCAFTAGEETVQVEAQSLLSVLNSELQAVNQKLQNAQRDLAQERERFQKMEEKEKARRLEAIKSAVKAKAQEIKDHADEDMDEKDCEDICENASAYVDCEDEKGDWAGDQKACEELMSRCMQKMLERKNQRSVVMWNNSVNKRDPEGIDGILARINK